MQIRTKETAGISDGVIHAHMRLLEGYMDTLRAAAKDSEYKLLEASLHTPFDEAALETAKKLGEQYGAQAKTVLLVGIGGSDLGTRAVYDALYGHLDQYAEVRKPRLVTFGTVEPRALQSMQDILAKHEKAEEVVLIVISKSGTTTETIANANVLYGLLAERFGPDAATRQTIIISDPNTPLATHAQELDITHVAMPHMVGGRYSVFTAVGLVPMAILGLDVDSFLEGARKGIEAVVSEDQPSSAAVLASFLFEAYLQGSRIHELFLFNPELETVGKWYRQLLAESIGKERPDGSRVGFSPTIAIGSVDLHSVGQLVFGGRNDRYTTFVSVPAVWEGTPPYMSTSPFTLSALEDKEVGEVMTAILGGVQAAYDAHDLAYNSIELSAIDERELGAFMALQFGVIMCLAQLFDVNAFDQPGVEAYKSEARRLLSK